MFIMFVGILLGVAAAIGSFFAGAGAAIGTAIGTAATAIVGFAKTLAATMATISMVDVVQIALAVTNWLAQKNQVLNENENVEELGAKAKQSDLKPDDFESTQAYIEHLRNNVTLDRENFNKLSAEEQLACKFVGMGIATKALSEKKGIEITPDFIAEVSRQKMTGAEAEAYIDNFKVGGESLDKFSGYLKGDLSAGENLRVSPILENALRQLNPDMSPEDIAKKVNGMQETAKMKNPEQV
jgi:hypothetical protein